MRQFRFARMLKKYSHSYIFVRPAGGVYDQFGDWQPGGVERVVRKGNIQPVDEKLVQSEGGRYESGDQTLYTTHKHDAGDLVEYMDTQYEVSPDEQWGYSDINVYLLKRRVVHDPV